MSAPEAAAAAAPPYAGLRRRLLAALIDNLVWLVFYSWLYGGVVAATYTESPEAAGVLVFVYLSLWFNYFALCEWRWGQTIGKNATGIEVASVEGGKVGFGQASIRGLLRIVDFFVIGWVMIAASSRKQRLGDKAAKTVVLRRPPRRAAAPAAAGSAEPRTAAAEIFPDAAGALTASTEAGRHRGDEPAPEPAEATSTARSRLPGVPWTPKDTVWGLIAGLFLAVLVAPAFVLPFDSDLSSTGALLAAQGLLGGTLLFVAVGMASRWKPAEARQGLVRLGLRAFRPSAIGLLLLTLFVYYIGAALFATVVIEPKQEDIGGDLGVGGSDVLVAVTAVVLIAGLAPLSEELFFRGFVFAGFRSRWPLWPAALVSGLVFGLVHAPTGITTVVPLAGLGVAMCWLYDRTGSLWPCVIAHTVNNGLALAVLA